MAYAIIGTAGHIDHGKTRLVQALTGTNTDRLAEEQRRGMTLDLGFTWFDVDGHRMAVIDVPGHEKYIANMLSGVAAIDIGLLVVAADEGVAVQTREHLAILSSLNVPHLVVALTKSDLSDDVTMAIIEDDVLELCMAHNFADANVYRVSSQTGRGLGDLKTQLVMLTSARDKHPVDGPFRMPVDRSFSIEGRGCVVAGTIWQGRVADGDTVQVMPAGQTVRVREVEVHGAPVPTAEAGYRTAMNLVGISHHEVSRGCELAQPDSFSTTERCVAKIRMYGDAPEVANGRIVRLHSAAGGIETKILTGGPSLQPDQTSVAILKCHSPLVLAPGQPFLLRRPGASGTFAGGHVLAANRTEGHRTGRLIDFGQQLADASEKERVIAWLNLCRFLDVSDPHLSRDIGMPADQLRQTCQELCDTSRCIPVPESSWVVSAASRDSVASAMIRRLENRSEDGRTEWTDESSLIAETEALAPKVILRWLLNKLINNGDIIRLDRQITAGSALELSRSQQELLSSMLNRFRNERQPPNAAALPDLEQKSRKDIDALLKLAVTQSLLVHLGGGWFLTPNVLDQLKDDLKATFVTTAEQTVAEIRDHWGLTRKHVVPFLEYFDKSGFTRRKDNIRTIGPKLSE